MGHTVSEGIRSPPPFVGVLWIIEQPLSSSSICNALTPSFGALPSRCRLRSFWGLFVGCVVHRRCLQKRPSTRLKLTQHFLDSLSLTRYNKTSIFGHAAAHVRAYIVARLAANNERTSLYQVLNY